MARSVIPGSTVMVTRRCVSRKFLLLPHGELKRAIEFALAWCAAHYGIELHLVNFMSNHFHLLLTDVRGVLPNFMRDFDQAVASCVHRVQGVRGQVFERGKYNVVRLADEHAVWAKMVYVCVQAVEAGIVNRHEEWVGLHTRVDQVGVLQKKVSPVFGQSVASEDLRLEFTIPPALRKYSPGVVREQLEQLVRQAEYDKRAERKRNGRKLLGVEKALSMSPEYAPNSWEESGGIVPSFAASSREEFHRQVKERREWRRAYLAARAAWVADRSVIFPAGTWWVVRHAGAAAAAA